MLLASLVFVALLIGALGWRVLRPSGTVAVRAEATAFDPFGSGPPGENDPLAARAVDGDAKTAWETERYNDPDVAGQKGGVGLILDLERRRSVERLDVTSPSRGWAADVYVLDERPTGALDTWGRPAVTGDAIDGDAGIDLGGAEGRIVILWITRTADDGQVAVREATLVVRT